MENLVQKMNNLEQLEYRNIEWLDILQVFAAIDVNGLLHFFNADLNDITNDINFKVTSDATYYTLIKGDYSIEYKI